MCIILLPPLGILQNLALFALPLYQHMKSQTWAETLLMMS